MRSMLTTAAYNAFAGKIVGGLLILVYAKCIGIRRYRRLIYSLVTCGQVNYIFLFYITSASLYETTKLRRRELRRVVTSAKSLSVRRKAPHMVGPACAHINNLCAQKGDTDIAHVCNN